MSSKKLDIESYYDKNNLDEQRAQYRELCTKELSKGQLTNFLWNMGTIQNVRYPGILGFEGIFKKKPAVVVGAGPSLDKNAHLLDRDKMIIITCDAALPVLVKKYKIYPHFVVMVDPTEKQKVNFKDIDTTKFYTVVPPVVHPSIFRVVDPKNLLVYNLKDPKNEIFEQAPYHIGKRGAMTAAVLSTGSCFCFAAAMHCDPIIFIGMDLSWASTDKVYADGIEEWKVNYQKNAKFRGSCMIVPDIYGKKVLTHQTLFIFWAWLRDQSQYITNKLINATEGGILKFKGMQVMPFKQAIEKHCSKLLVGVEEKIQNAYFYEFSDGLIEKVLLPPFKKQYHKMRQKIVGGKN